MEAPGAIGAPLVAVEREAAGAPEGLLVLHHGRGTSETDLIPLGDALDPQRRLLVVAPRGPLQIPGWPGYHWYAVPRVGRPDPDTFFTARAALAALQDRLWEETGIGPERTVLGGFSMGAVMSHGLGWSGDRPAVAGVLAFSGFVPAVPGWEPSLADRPSTCAFVAHGDRDPVIGVEFGRAARDLLEQGGIEVAYVETEAGHQIDPPALAEASAWTRRTLGL
ncbi:MAG TPA: phospholipase [Solirubrobacterales bacterium]|jgi:phospholipase/carboxylesterase